ncbi:MAG: FKBP-type peptidyl-prolyl cis-trans isomerase, partial [Geopsychrobacter sp.]|nr:FKBP-type peptidyl-prolyl cis-trans isomerase [Geopsychrobacter sp.]
MKRICCLLLILSCAVPAFSASLEEGQQKISYAIGMSIGGDLARQELDLDMDKLAAGIAATYTKSDALLSNNEMVKVLTDFQKKVQAKQIAKSAAVAEGNRAKGEEFLVKNAKKAGVVTTASGLQYEVLNKGEGATPTANDQVSVNYRGTLVDGTEFDSSYKRGEPATFRVGGVIAGWTEALQLMKEGGKLKLVIP